MSAASRVTSPLNRCVRLSIVDQDNDEKCNKRFKHRNPNSWVFFLSIEKKTFLSVPIEMVSKKMIWKKMLKHFFFKNAAFLVKFWFFSDLALRKKCGPPQNELFLEYFLTSKFLFIIELPNSWYKCSLNNSINKRRIIYLYRVLALISFKGLL